MNVYVLRPHHINCLFFYEGRGYSEQFIKTMDALVQALEENPDQILQFRQEPDQLCLACPHRRGDGCQSGDRISRLDQKTLEEYQLEEGKDYTFESIKEAIYKQYSPVNLEKICCDCEWYKQQVCHGDKIVKQKNKWCGASF